jgi:3'-phosphoadenosine 5'-phosphosulfate sulfotransferase (PAPS reductase)/FAD synthetase
MRQEPTTVLSFGAGQDSTAILYRLALDPVFRARYAAGHLLVVCADTGDEHPETYAHVERTKRFCLEHGIEFVHITASMGFHLKGWQSLRARYRANNCIGSKSYPKTCTMQLKVGPIYKFLEAYLGQHYGVTVGKKRGFYEYAKRHGKLRVLIGIAAGEESRVAKPSDAKEERWMAANIEKAYPLLDLGWDRKACQDYIQSVGLVVPPPSNCMLCPFMSEVELLWLYRHHPRDYEEWVMLERAKLDQDARGRPNRHGIVVITPVEKRFGVWGRRTLPEVLASAIAKFGHMSDEELQQHKMSHGHCVKSNWS